MSSSTTNQLKRLNRLASAQSPYLLQHAENPVDWYEWGAEAFEKAKREDKPIFLSVGYSACHWCHVHAHESFEDEITAKIMNENYVNIKVKSGSASSVSNVLNGMPQVDREERPDVDGLYMTFLQATSGGGGWPMSVWLTPDLHPFFAGTYLPPGQFRQVLLKLAELWKNNREAIVSSGKAVMEQLEQSANIAPGTDVQIFNSASTVFIRLNRIFDSQHGGFGGAPKFPSPSQTLHFLARYAALGLTQSPTVLNKEGDTVSRTEAERARDMAVQTLVKIYNGGIRDVVGGGFSRYSVDECWHVPHFEKMLYDQAQLLTSALEVSQLLPADSPDRQTLQAMAADIVTYVSRDLRSPFGGFYSAEDADSLPGSESTVKKEGAFYVWTAKKLDELLGEDSQIFKYHFGVKEEGNCDPQHDIQGELKGQNVLYTAHTVEDTAAVFGKTPQDVQAIRDKSLTVLKDCRDRERPRPHLDDKILTSWNGLMISGLSKAFETLDPKYGLGPTSLKLAEDAAAFIREKLYDEETGKLTRSYRKEPGPTGQADDYAFLIQGMLDLYEASGKEVYISWAIRLQEKQDELFYDDAKGGYFVSAPDPHVLIRMKDAQDGAEPSASSVTLSNLNRLSHFADNRHGEYHAKADSIVKANAQILKQAPFALANMVSGAMLSLKGYKQFIVSGEPAASETSAFLQAIREQFIPNRVLIHLDPSKPPKEIAKVNDTISSLIKDESQKADDKEGKPNVRICENFTCGLPVYEVDELERRLP
ncbi:hypothetical protein K474DRAFT_1709403 [Panus rudis PR-1116 ss-1]|nr:hypothetical protein K474DRAFT_1709403 [Panus rudis PR-1116 ss-1]